MATRRSNIDYKGIKHRGVYGGREQSVTGVIKLRAGESLALTDLAHMIPMGENVRPIRMTLAATPVKGTPVLSGGVMDVGVVKFNDVPFKRPDGTEFPAIPEVANAFGQLTLPTGQPLLVTKEVNRPVAASVPNYAPYRVTLKANTAPLAVTGGDVEIALTVVYVGEQIAEPYVYLDFLSQKVLNDAGRKV